MKSFREYIAESELLMEMRGFEFQNSKYTIGVTKDGGHTYWKDGREIPETVFRKKMEQAGVKPENLKKQAVSMKQTVAYNRISDTKEDIVKLFDRGDGEGAYDVDEYLHNSGYEKEKGRNGVRFTSKPFKDGSRIRVTAMNKDGIPDWNHPHFEISIEDAEEETNTEKKDVKPVKNTDAHKKQVSVMSHVNMMYGDGDIEGERDAEDYLKSEGYKKEEGKNGVRFTSKPFKDGSRMRITVKNDKYDHPDWRNADYEVVQDD